MEYKVLTRAGMKTRIRLTKQGPGLKEQNPVEKTRSRLKKTESGVKAHDGGVHAASTMQWPETGVRRGIRAMRGFHKSCIHVCE